LSHPAKDLVKSLLTVDLAKRATPEQALSHPWIAGEAASNKNIMDTFKEGLKKNPRERLRAAVAKVQAMRAFRNASLNDKKEDDETPAPAAAE
jgi:serine/threonine protein kinase